MFHEAVVEGDVLPHPQLLGQTLQAEPVAFAFRAHEMRMGRPEHDIDQIRILPDDLGQRPDHVLDPLARGEQAEGQQHLLALDPELILEGARIDERRVRNAVRDQIDLGGRGTIDLAQNRAPALGHHDQPFRLPDDLVHHPPLVGSGLLQDGVQGRHHGKVDLAQDGQNMAARPAAIDPELMLQADHVEAVEPQEVHRLLIVAQALLLDLELHFRPIVVTFRHVIDGQHAALRLWILSGHGIAQVVREGGDAAPARHDSQRRTRFLRAGLLVSWLIGPRCSRAIRGIFNARLLHRTANGASRSARHGASSSLTLLQLENRRVDMLIGCDHGGDRKAPLDAAPAGAAVDLGESAQRLDGLLGRADQETGLPVLDDLAAGAEIHRDHGHARGIGLGQDQAEPFRDRVQVQERARRREQRVLACHTHGPDVVDRAAIEMGLDLRAEIGLVLHDAGDDQAPPAQARDLDREMNALVRMDAAEKDQVVTGAFLERVEREIDPVVDGRQIVQRGGAVGVADGDVVAVAILLIDRHDLGRGEAMDRGQHRGPDQAAVAQGHEVVVAVNQVELAGVLERFRDVKVFGDLGIGGGVLLITLVDHGVEPGAGDRVPGGEQGHVPAARDQAFGEVAGHRFPGAVLPRRGPPGDR